MTTDWLTALQQFGRMRSMSAMETLQRQGEPQHSLFWLQEGTARAVYHSAQGQEKVKEFYFAGECCFLYLSWLTGSVADYSLQMLTPGRLCEIPLRLLDKPEHLTARLALLSQQVIYKEKKSRCFCSIIPNSAGNTCRPIFRTGSNSSRKKISPVTLASPR